MNNRKLKILLICYFRQSGAGKTWLICRILEQMNEIISPVPTKVVWYYSKYLQKYHDALKEIGLNIEFHSQLDYSGLMSQIESESDERFLVIIDDALSLESNIDEIFTR